MHSVMLVLAFNSISKTKYRLLYLHVTQIYLHYAEHTGSPSCQFVSLRIVCFLHFIMRRYSFAEISYICSFNLG